MDFLADIVLGAAAVGAAIFCALLSRRLQRLTNLDSDLGTAIAVMSRQVDGLGKLLFKAQDNAAQAESSLNTQVNRAEAVARKLELLVAALHDLPEPASAQAPRSHRPQSAWTGGVQGTNRSDRPTDPPPQATEAHIGRRRLVRRRAEAGGAS